MNNKNIKNTSKIVTKNNLIKVKIPIDPMNPLDIIIPIQINGNKFICKRGETIELSEEYVKLLEESGYLN